MFRRRKRSLDEDYRRIEFDTDNQEQEIETTTLEQDETEKESLQEEKPEKSGQEEASEKAEEENPEEDASEKVEEEEDSEEEVSEKEEAEEDSEEDASEKVEEEENPEEEVSEKEEAEEDLEEEVSEKEEAEEEEEVPVKRFTVLKRILLAVVILAASVVMTFGYSLWSEYSSSESYDGNEITVDIPKGSSSRQMASILQDAGVIRYETPFLAKIYFSGYRGKLRYGTFRLNDGMCLEEIVRELSTAGALKDEKSFTVPEGYSIEMIAAKLQKEGIMDSEEFLTACENAASGFVYADELPDKEQVNYQLQGYLYPDTYRLTENMTGDELVKKMLQEFVNKFDSERQAQAKKAGLTVQEVLTRASLVQKETEKTDEYAMIAGVINNRLEENMKLQFDSTTVYAMTEGMYGVSRVTYGDLKLQSVYNTYYVKGLPVGPICNPGLDAIDGVLNAKKHQYLYFQMDKTKNDGSNLFFETYEEHAAASATTAAEEEETDTQQAK